MDSITYNAAGGVHVAYCDRCGQSLSHPINFRGKNYGGDCFEIVTGTRADRWIMRGGAVDEQATAERDRRREARRADDAARAQAWQAECAIVAAEQDWIIQTLADSTGLAPQEIERQIDQGCGGFVVGMIRELRRFRIADEKAFTARQQMIIAEIWAKQTSGARKNSRAYYDAYDEFTRRAGLWQDAADEEGEG